MACESRRHKNGINKVVKVYICCNNLFVKIGCFLKESSFHFI